MCYFSEKEYKLETIKDFFKDKKNVISTALLLTIIALSIYVGVKVASYTGGVISILVVICLLTLIAGLFMSCKRKTKFVIYIEITFLIVLVVISGLIYKVSGVLYNISDAKEYEVVQIVALKTSNIEPTNAFDTYVLGYCDDDNDAYNRSSDILVENNKKVATSRPFENTTELYNSFMANNVQLLVLTSDIKSDLSVIDEEYQDKIVILFEKKYEIDPVKMKPVDITKEPFTVYFCGADLSSGEDISSTGRGDVNILLTVNPNTEKVHLQVIPRDTFVYIPCRGGSSKLSYSGWWGGVQSSIDSIEDKFGIEINYYAKLNFNGLVDLVDALGGITVYSHYTYSYQGYSFVEGYNDIDGEKALRFVRARKMLPENELSRGQHQMELIKGIFKKFAENPTYDKGLAIIDALSNNFVTNLPEEDYYDAFKLIVKLLPELQEMDNHSIEGEYKWHYDEVRDGYYQYYYYPNPGEIERVRNSINNIIFE